MRQSRKRAPPAWQGGYHSGIGGGGGALDDITNDDEDLASLVAMGFDERKGREVREANSDVTLIVRRPLDSFAAALRCAPGGPRERWRCLGRC